MALLQLSERGTLDFLLGNCIGQNVTVLTAGASAIAATTVTTRGSAGSGNMDATPANGSMLFIATPGSGATQNQYTNVEALIITSATATSLTFPANSLSKARAAGDFIFLLNSAATSPLTTTPATFANTWYIGLTTQLTSGATSANILSGEPTSTGSYARVAVLNNPTNFTAATGSLPATKTTGAIVSFPASSAVWSTGATTLKAFFIADASTLAGGNVLAIGDLTTPQAVNASGITPSFAVGQLSATLQ